jgi:hypothetical protein
VPVEVVLRPINDSQFQPDQRQCLDHQRCSVFSGEELTEYMILFKKCVFKCCVLVFAVIYPAIKAALTPPVVSF